jgi:hypothetical protein
VANASLEFPRLMCCFDLVRLNAFHMNSASMTKLLLIHCDIGNPYLGKLAKPTQGPFKIIDIQQLPINGTILIQQSPTSVEHVNICRLLPFFECYNWGCECCTSVIMTLWPTHALIHDITTKYPKPTKLMKWLVTQNCKSDSLLKTFHLQPFFKKHISLTWQPQKSL